jgi:hypothetical protein
MQLQDFDRGLAFQLLDEVAVPVQAERKASRARGQPAAASAGRVARAARLARVAWATSPIDRVPQARWGESREQASKAVSGLESRRW